MYPKIEELKRKRDNLGDYISRRKSVQEKRYAERSKQFEEKDKIVAYMMSLKDERETIKGKISMIKNQIEQNNSMIQKMK